ncbi:DNA polymerase subunit beta [bacterium]|nr:DNA polymerase subunit beta [bacterium]
MRKQEVIDILTTLADDLRGQGVQSISLFGSTARDENKAGSHIDLLVDFGQPPTFDQYIHLKFFLEDHLGAHVDLVTPTALHERVRPYVEAEAIRVA